MTVSDDGNGSGSWHPAFLKSWAGPYGMLYPGEPEGNVGALRQAAGAQSIQIGLDVLSADLRGLLLCGQVVERRVEFRFVGETPVRGNITAVRAGSSYIRANLQRMTNDGGELDTSQYLFRRKRERAGTNGFSRPTPHGFFAVYRADRIGEEQIFVQQSREGAWAAIRAMYPKRVGVVDPVIGKHKKSGWAYVFGVGLPQRQDFAGRFWSTLADQLGVSGVILVASLQVFGYAVGVRKDASLAWARTSLLVDPDGGIRAQLGNQLGVEGGKAEWEEVEPSLVDEMAFSPSVRTLLLDARRTMLPEERQSLYLEALLTAMSTSGGSWKQCFTAQGARGDVLLPLEPQSAVLRAAEQRLPLELRRRLG